MITLAVVGILVSIAMPNFNSFLKENRLRVAANDFVGAMSFARAEAVRKSRPVYLSAVNNSSYTSGMYVWMDRDKDSNRDGDEFLRYYDDLDSNITVTVTSNLASIGFLNTGMLEQGSTVTFTFCDSSRSGETGYALELLGSGRVTLDTITTCG
jgi:type IV fimbrial biogenesis protein FimT